MSGKKVGVFGIYSTRIAVENAADSLMKAGFPASDISVLLPESLGGPKDMGTEKATKAPEGAAAGVTTGGVIGGTLGLLAGVGLLAIPGLGPFIAAGPVSYTHLDVYKRQAMIGPAAMKGPKPGIANRPTPASRPSVPPITPPVSRLLPHLRALS